MSRARDVRRDGRIAMVYIIAEEAYVGRRAGGVGQTGVPIAHLEYFCDSEMRPIWRLYDTAGAIGAGRKSLVLGIKSSVAELGRKRGERIMRMELGIVCVVRASPKYYWSLQLD